MKRPTRLLGFGLGCFLAMAFPGTAQMTMNVEIIGDVQGPIEGDVPVQGQPEKQIAGLEYHHQMAIGSKGVGEHKQVIWTKLSDRSSVQLWTAFRDGELLEVTFHHLDSQGIEVMEVILADARILAIETYHPEGDLAPLERIRMVYRVLENRQQGQSLGVTDPQHL